MRLKREITVWVVLFSLLGIFGGCYEQSLEGFEEQISVVDVAPWPDGEVYYCFEGFDVNNEDDRYSIISVKRAMQEWSSSARISFIEKPEAGDYVVRIIKSDKTASTLGYVKNARMYLTTCASQRQATHELGHVLGLTHEHQRVDRDLYITVHWNNIQPEAVSQYQLLENTLYDEESYPYDYRSVMHYSQSAGGINVMTPTYTINDPNFNEKWPTYLSKGDRDKVIEIYGAIAQ